MANENERPAGADEATPSPGGGENVDVGSASGAPGVSGTRATDFRVAGRPDHGRAASGRGRGARPRVRRADLSGARGGTRPTQGRHRFRELH